MNQNNLGHLHPITQTINDIVVIFREMGFDIAFGIEIETGENNFDVLNFPPDHPARDMQDTFWLKDDPTRLLRTQTSNHQVPYIKEHGMPVRMISFGKVFRNEATDATHEAAFYQVEGLMVDEKGKVTLGHLKGVLETFIKKLFDNNDIELRLRPGYFPFVEPGVEIDLKFKDNWLEVLGAGMVHPNVLRNADVDPEKYTGFAFGVGVDRLIMMRHNIPDGRLSYHGDLRFVNQF